MKTDMRETAEENYLIGVQKPKISKNVDTDFKNNKK